MNKTANVWTEIDQILTTSIEDLEKNQIGAEKHRGARKEWNDEVASSEMEVPIEDLLQDEYYLGRFKIWESVRKELAEIWHMRCDFDVTFAVGETTLQTVRVYALSWEHAKRKAIGAYPTQYSQSDKVSVRRSHNIHTVVIETPKGTGKDFEMSLAIWLLTREFLIQPREEFFEPYNLDMDTTISINCMNRSEDQAKKVTFKELLPKFDTPFFNDYFPPQIDISDMQDKRQYPSELRFPRNVVIFPGSGSAATGLGYCIGAGVIDEANFMERTGSSKRALTGADEYDAAREAYEDLYQRQESRFGAIRHGQMCLAGLIIVISSSRTTNDFTQKMKQRAHNDRGIFYTSKPFWERKPLNLSGKTFSFDVDNVKIINSVQAEETLEAVTAA